MRADDEVQKIREAAARLNPTALYREGQQSTRGGLPSSSFGQTRGAELPMPQLDRTDARWLREWPIFRVCVHEALVSLERARRIQSGWLLLDPPAPDQQQITACSNLLCDVVLDGIGNNKPRSGQCPACDQHDRRLRQKGVELHRRAPGPNGCLICAQRPAVTA